MNVFSQTQRYKALFWLSLFHLLVITSSNYLVQLPVSIFGFHTTWGAFSFPFIFLATDLTVRIFGAPLARRIIFAVMIPALLISYVISSLFYMASAGFGVIATFITLFYDAKGWDGAAFALTLFSCAFVGTRLLFPNGINRIGGWHRQRPHCSVTSATRWPFSSLPSGVARMPLWLNTGWKSRWSITVSKC